MADETTTIAPETTTPAPASKAEAPPQQQEARGDRGDEGRGGGRGRGGRGGGRGQPGSAGPSGAGKRREEGGAPAGPGPEIAVRNRREATADSVVTPAAETVTVTEDVDFAALMGDPSKKDAGGTRFEPGMKVKGVVEVVSLHGQEIFLDLGEKATGYVLKEEVRDADGQIVVKPGDVIEGVVVGFDSNGIKLRVKLGQEADNRAVREAFEAGLLVEGKVAGTNKGGYDVRIGNVRAFCPHSQIDVVRIEGPAAEALVGQTFTFKITEIKENGSVVVSRSAVLKAEQATRAAEIMAKIQPGAKMTARVRSIQKFGVFVDLGGKDGLIPMAELAWNRVEDAHDVVQLGQEVEVVVLDVNSETGKIALSLRRGTRDPFEVAAEKLQTGEVVTGQVTRLKDFGAFVELAPDVEGLVHISDLAHYRVRHPKDILKVGETVRVKVIEVDVERHRIALSLKATSADPWDHVPSKYKVGDSVKGLVESVQEFGVFVALEPGVVALLPMSEAKLEGKQAVVEFKVGKEVEARVLRIDPNDRKMALTRRDDEELKARPDRAGGDRERRQQTMRDLEQRHGGGGGGRGGGGFSGGPRERDEWSPKRGTLAYSDTVDKGKDAPKSALAEALMRAMKKDK
ncbi:MAG: S1 RNA-binding domain-containing protein [Deltaproteobacteria bacterium]|nr:S1 RNA-binding domain-containing protein [Deltaproteobacteria bacterium]